MTTTNMNPIGSEITIDGRTIGAETPRVVLADLLESLGRDEDAKSLRSDSILDVDGGVVSIPEMTLEDLFEVNGQGDDDEPWCAADDCPLIDVDGADLIALCSDGVAIWRNNDREWSELGYGAATLIERWAGREKSDPREVAKAARLGAWMDQF